MDGRREYVKLRLKITGASFSYQVCVVCSAVESNENGLNAAVPEEALDQHNRTVLVQTRYAAPASRGCLQNSRSIARRLQQHQAARDRSFQVLRKRVTSAHAISCGN
jgi:hypothetical protein